MAADPVVLNGRYRLIDRIGSGGMSVVYRAQGLSLGRIGAILPDIAVLDVEMPGLDGFDVCAAIRQARGDAFPLVLVTGRSDHEFFDRAVQLSASYIIKPVNWGSLADLLRSLIAVKTR